MVAEPADPAPTEAAPGETAHAETAQRLAEARASERTAVLDAMTDGVLLIAPDGRIVAANRAAAALFGYAQAELLARRFAELLAPASRTAALEALAGVATAGGAIGPRDDGRELIGQGRDGATLPLRLWLGRMAGDGQICATFRDATPAAQAQRELAAARETAAAAETTAAAKAAADKSEFVVKVSHELRTPLNSILGFAEVMLEERFGPIGNERYRDYLKDIRASGDHAVALLNDLVLLVKIAAGQLDLDVMEVDLNDAVQACVAQMQPQANRERIIIRTSLAVNLPPAAADPGALRQIVLNLLTNAIRFTGTGGQVIVSTAVGEAGGVVLRVRDTGIGIEDKELAATLEPFRQSATASRWGATGTGLCLPLTKALAQANRARFTIVSKVNDGTLVEVAFQAARGHAD
jgi:PAS domain S-box-containing protein